MKLPIIDLCSVSLEESGRTVVPRPMLRVPNRRSRCRLSRSEGGGETGPQKVPALSNSGGKGSQQNIKRGRKGSEHQAGIDSEPPQGEIENQT